MLIREIALQIRESHFLNALASKNAIEACEKSSFWIAPLKVSCHPSTNPIST